MDRFNRFTFTHTEFEVYSNNSIGFIFQNNIDTLLVTYNQIVSAFSILDSSIFGKWAGCADSCWR